MATKIVEEVNDILNEMVIDTSCELEACHYQSPARINIDMDNSTTPVANFYCMTDWGVDMSNGIVRETANVGILFLCRQYDLNFDGISNETEIGNAYEIALDFVARVSHSDVIGITSDNIDIKSVYDQNDYNLTGVFIKLNVREKVGKCLESYATD